MIILGIDPGLAKTGYGVIEADGDRISHIAHDTISTDSHLGAGSRLKMIYAGICKTCESYKPDYAAVESLYFSKNISSAFPVAQARGVAILALAQNDIDTREYSPLEIKQSITGNGRADKRQVQDLVRFLLSLKENPKPDHAADALATAICCFHIISAEVKMQGPEKGKR
jgi:crossover junction endodeoxyribonuclease RuvC